MSGRRTKASRRAMPRHPLMLIRDENGTPRIVKAGLRQFKRGTLYDPSEPGRRDRNVRAREARARENEPRIEAGKQHVMHTSYGKDKRAGCHYGSFPSARRTAA